jgi:hypothetical protein
MTKGAFIFFMAKAGNFEGITGKSNLSPYP